MPRQAHGRPVQSEAPSRQRKRKTARVNTLTALEQAEQQTPDDYKVRRTRLGEIEDDSEDERNDRQLDEPSTKRRKVGEFETDGDIDEGSDLEGGRWHEGVDEEDEDSDIDSEEAFGESDEDRFAHFTFRGSGDKAARKSDRPAQNKSVKQKQSQADDDGWETAEAFNNADDQDEEKSEDENMEDIEEEEDDDLGDEAVDLATALDMNEEEDRAEAARAQKKGKKTKNIQVSESEASADDDEDEKADDDSEEDASDEESAFSISEDEAQGDVSGLRKFVDSLNTPALTGNSTSRQKGKTQSLPSKPSRFGISSANLTASDLLQYITDPTQRSSLKMLTSADRAAPETYKPGTIPGKLAAPLAKRQQDRLDRAAAYEKSKETLNRWIETVKQNRRAEHLSFPLPDPAKESATSTKKLALASHGEPLTELESTIQNIMQESGLASRDDKNDAKAVKSLEDQEQAFEELASRSIPLEELRERRAELRRARDLLFREEVRAKRIKKIKSKSYRRVHRKEKERNEAREMEEMKAGGLVDEEAERETMERQRAEERMGSRHRESRWAKAVKSSGRTVWDEDVRGGVAEAARRDEELRRRVEGRGAGRLDDEEGTESDSDSDDDDDDDEEYHGRKLSDKLTALDKSNNEPKSRLANMAFMQKAEATRKAVNDEETRQLRLALGSDAGQIDDSEDDDDTNEISGRQRFGVSSQSGKAKAQPQKQVRNEFEARLSEDEDEDQEEPETSLPAAGKVVTPIRKNSAALKSKDVTKPVPLANGSAGGLAKREATKSQSKNNRTHGTTLTSLPSAAADDYTSPSESEDEAHTPDDDRHGAHETLADAIFAGPDDTAAEFAREKKAIEEEEGDQVIDNGLPGWGSWTGDGVSKREQKRNRNRFLTTVKGVAPDKRQDNKLDRVIINEKRVKKNGKYLATELPHPFETRQQYERSLRLPMGPEWSTVNHYNDAIKPRVLLKQGTVIKPMARPTV